MDYTTLATGLRTGEGPLVLPDRSILYCEVQGGRLTRVSPAGEVLQQVEVGGGPNGAAVGPDGRIYVCNNGGISARDVELLSQGVANTTDPPSAGFIQAVDLATGAVASLYTAYGDTPLQAPNDLVFDAAGGLWFTDYGNLRDPAPLPGVVCYAKADGSHIRLAIPGLERPNGVGLSPAGDIVYVAETHAGRLLAYPVTGPGEVDLAARRVLFEDPSVSLDSLAVQADGRVCVASPSRNLIVRVHPKGGAEQIPTPPGWPSNICFGGEDLRTAYLTGLVPGELWRAQWDSPGLKLAF